MLHRSGAWIAKILDRKQASARIEFARGRQRSETAKSTQFRRLICKCTKSGFQMAAMSPSQIPVRGRLSVSLHGRAPSPNVPAELTEYGKRGGVTRAHSRPGSRAGTPTESLLFSPSPFIYSPIRYAKLAEICPDENRGQREPPWMLNELGQVWGGTTARCIPVLQRVAQRTKSVDSTSSTRQPSTNAPCCLPQAECDHLRPPEPDQECSDRKYRSHRCESHDYRRHQCPGRHEGREVRYQGRPEGSNCH